VIVLTNCTMAPNMPLGEAFPADALARAILENVFG
jgi:hypothetical protein